MSADEQGHNGWKNYETWSVALIIDNDQRTERESRDVVRLAVMEARQDDPEARVVDEASHIKYRVADALKDWVERQLERNTEPSEAEPMSYLVSQLVHAALGEVDWDEIAESFLADLEDS